MVTKRKKAVKKAKPLLTKETKHILVGLAVLAVLFFVLTSVFGKLGTFDYEGLTFVQEKFGQLDVFRYTYFYEGIDGNIIKYNMYLRVDPRENDVPVTGGAIQLPAKSRQMYISIDTTDMRSCQMNSVAVSSLSAFLTNNQYPVKGATPFEAEAELRDLPFADCNSHPDNAVFIVKLGDVTKVEKQSEFCWVLQAANCELVEVVEKFEVQTVLDARARAA